MPDTERRLAAILAADVASYSRLMADDEDATVRTLRAWREQVSALVVEHRGRLADFTGDNFLAEFPAARDAVECALEIQSVLETRNRTLPEARRMRFRMGAHLGDVRVEEGRLFGDGVNVAARLQSLAEPGGLCLSAALVELVRGKLPLDLEDLGEKTLKNLPTRVRAYRVRVGALPAATPATSSAPASSLRIGAIVAIAAIGISGSVLLWLRIRPTDAAVPSASAAAAPTAASITLAVLPFVNLTDDPDQEYFSEGISEDILDGLGRNHSLVVRAWRSSFLFKEKDADLRRIAEQLDVAYLVNGSVRRQGQRIRVTARLTNVAANTDIWSNRYEGELEDVFALQDQITEAIVSALGEHFSAREKRPVAPAAYDAYLLGRYHVHRHEFASAVARLSEAIALDPGHADAYATLAQLHAIQAWGSSPELAQHIAKEREYIAAALEQDPHQPLALGLDAMRLPAQRGVATLDALVRAHPNDPDLHFFYSTVLHRVGRLDLELALLDRMVELDPLAPTRFTTRAQSHVAAGRLADARDDIRRTEQLGLPNPFHSFMVEMIARDVSAARRQLERPLEEWTTYPTFWREIFAAQLAFLEGDADGVRERLRPLELKLAEYPWWVRHQIALLNRDPELALAQLEAALRHGEPLAVYESGGSAYMRLLFPQFYRSARRQELLRELELDEASLARVVVPPLPF